MGGAISLWAALAACSYGEGAERSGPGAAVLGFRFAAALEWQAHQDRDQGRAGQA
jgi:hypothetical protein